MFYKAKRDILTSEYQRLDNTSVRYFLTERKIVLTKENYFTREKLARFEIDEQKCSRE